MRLLFFASSYECGLSSLCTQQTCAIAPLIGDGFRCVTGEREQFPGLADRLCKRGISHAVINGLDRHEQFDHALREVRRILRSVRPTVVQVQTNWQLMLVSLAGTELHVRPKVVYWVHAFRNNHPMKSVLARAAIGGALYFTADKVVVSSSYVRRKFGFLGKRLWPCMLGVDETYLVGHKPINDLRAPKRLVCAGEFRTGKNQDGVIRAMAAYCRKSGDRDVELHLPGDGPLRAQCITVAEQAGVRDQVHFPGQLDRGRMLDLYRNCHIAVVASNSETFGSSIVEPFVLGRIVMTRRVGVAEDLIRHGRNGLQFDTDEDLSAMFLRVLPEIEKSYPLATRAYEQRHLFDWAAIAPEYVRMLQELA